MSGRSYRRFELVFAIHPTSRGFCWVLFDRPGHLANWGMVDVNGDKNAGCLLRIENLLKRHSPAILVLEDVHCGRSRRSERVRLLYRSMIHAAEEHEVSVRVYPRITVGACFAPDRVRTRQEIAEAVAQKVAPLRHIVPPRRKLWSSEHRRLGLFQAAALALTYFSPAGDQRPPS
jgi:hypothetical protein